MSKQLVQTFYTVVKPAENINTGICVKYQHTGHKFPVKEQKGIFFTQEEYNKHITEIIENTLRSGAENVKIDGYLDLNNEDKDSILNTFEETYLKYKI